MKKKPAVHHTANVTEYTLDDARMEVHKDKLFCSNPRCGKPFKVGDRIVSKRTSSSYGGKTKLYCKKCAKELNIIS